MIYVENYDVFSGKDLEIADKILRRRLQMLVHSYLYYSLDTNIISDRQFDIWAKDLVELQHNYPDISKQVEYYTFFKNWDGTTGFDLPKTDDISRIAYRLANICKVPISKKVQPVKVVKVVEPVKKSKKLARKSLF